MILLYRILFRKTLLNFSSMIHCYYFLASICYVHTPHSSCLQSSFQLSLHLLCLSNVSIIPFQSTPFCLSLAFLLPISVFFAHFIICHNNIRTLQCQILNAQWQYMKLLLYKKCVLMQVFHFHQPLNYYCPKYLLNLHSISAPIQISSVFVHILEYLCLCPCFSFWI